MDINEEEYIAWFLESVEEDIEDGDWGYPSGFQAPEQNLNQKANQKKKKNPPFQAKCPECSREYKTLNGYSRHLEMHKMSAACRGIPDLEAFQEILSKGSQDTLKRLLEETKDRTVGHYPAIFALVEGLLAVLDSPEWSNFENTVGKCLKKCIPSAKSSPGRGAVFPMPSEMRSMYNISVSKSLFLCNEELVLNLMSFMEGVPREIFQKFVSMFFLRMSQVVFVKVLSSMKHSAAPNMILKAVPQKSDTQILRFKRVVHYVGGSVVRRILRRALPMMDKCEKWEHLVCVISSQLLSDDIQNCPLEELMAWTEAQDRGGLLKISNNALSFFLSLGNLAESCEKADGCLNHEEFMSSVHQCDALQLWDSLINGNLAPDSSEFLLDMCCHYFTNTWGNGSAKLRMNSAFKTSTVNRALRPSIPVKH